MTNRKLESMVEVVLSGQATTLLQQLIETPALATARFETEFLVEEIPHQIYAGDTLLHLAAAALRPDAAAVLVKAGAVVGATNRRGAQPIHYACDARPAHENGWNPAAQDKLIRFLVAEGADANSPDQSGVTPMHRAVRARSAVAVQALLCAGANPTARVGKNGSTPLHLAVTSTGASGTAGQTGVQAEIVRQLLAAGASLSDVDGRGRAVIDQIKSAALRQSLARVGILPES